MPPFGPSAITRPHRRPQRLRRLALLAALACGCAAPATGPLPSPLLVQNPVLVPMIDRDLLWDQVVDVVDDYLPIQQEQRLRQVGDVIVEGRLDTVPEVSATCLEPWRRDTPTMTERLESTLQQVRRRATVRAIPTAEGYLIDVAVFKELEDLARPMHSTTGASTLRNDSSLERFTSPDLANAAAKGWIPLGRDPALEQEILRKVMARFGVAPPPERLPPVTF